MCIRDSVWRFPFITGKYGGAAFVLLYLVFLVILGLPVMVMEFAVGRASQQSVARSFDELEPKGSKWHLHKDVYKRQELELRDIIPIDLSGLERLWQDIRDAVKGIVNKL